MFDLFSSVVSFGLSACPKNLVCNFENQINFLIYFFSCDFGDFQGDQATGIQGRN